MFHSLNPTSVIEAIGQSAANFAKTEDRLMTCRFVPLAVTRDMVLALVDEAYLAHMRKVKI